MCQCAARFEPVCAKVGLFNTSSQCSRADLGCGKWLNSKVDCQEITSHCCITLDLHNGVRLHGGAAKQSAVFMRASIMRYFPPVSGAAAVPALRPHQGP
jgi:hypothetical protein